MSEISSDQRHSDALGAEGSEGTARADDVILDARGLVRRYGFGESAVTVLHGVDLTIRRGEYIAIIGSSGSGKSTLMNLLGALDQPNEGEVRVGGRSLRAMTSDELATLRSRRFGFIFQRYHLIEALDALENVELPATYIGQLGTRARHERAQTLLAQMGLEGREHHAPRELSGGQCQRVAIARALMNDPEVLFADEPTGALDSASGAAVLDTLERLNREGRTIVMVTHDPKIAARAGRVIEIKDGRIVADRRREEATLNRPNGQAIPQTTANDDSAVWSPVGADTCRAVGVNIQQGVNASLQPRSGAAGVVAAYPRQAGAALLTVMLSSWSMALRSLARNRLRTFLTLTGVLIGVASVVALVGIGQGARDRMIEDVTALGSNLLEVRSGARSVRGSGGERARFDEDTVAGVRALDGVHAASPEAYAAQTVRYEREDRMITVQGVDPQWPQVREWPVALGRFLDAEHVSSYALVAVIGATTRDQLFGPGVDPVGEIILIGASPFRVIGVMAATGVTTGGGRHDRDDQIWVPFTTAGSRLFGELTFDRFVVRAADHVDPLALESDIVSALEARYPPDSFHVRNQADQLAVREAAQATFTRLLAAIAAIALIVGGIGVMNIMLVSVAERVQEIGVRMAVGARERDVMAQFLVESIVVCALGGLIGVALGLGVGAAADATGDWRMAYSWAPVLAAMSSAVLTGLLFGLWPARRAARMNPVQALSGG
ncbi:MAG: ABC transporter permease [Thioalkalivibrionaceae bacterium]